MLLHRLDVAQIRVCVARAESGGDGRKPDLVELPFGDDLGRLAREHVALAVAAVISVGTASIAAFIGAGGFGERIGTGLALNDHTMLLAGAIAAAAVAMATQWTFEFAERRFASRRRPGCPR